MEENNKFLIPIAIIIAGALIAWGIATKDNTNDPTTNNNGDVVSEITYRPVDETDHGLGDPNADIILIEYSDLECPFCKNFHITTKALMEEFGKNGKLALVFRHFPLDQLHSKARKEAIATECAANLGGNEKFWEYLDIIFMTTPSNNGFNLEKLPEIAEQIGLDKEKFNTCLEDQLMAERVESYYQDGIKAGVLGTATDPGGTPYSLLVTKDGKVLQIKGAQTYETVKVMIESLLK